MLKFMYRIVEVSIKISPLFVYVPIPISIKSSAFLTQTRNLISHCVVIFCLQPKPGIYIKQTEEQAMFYGNRVLKDYKGK